MGAFSKSTVGFGANSTWFTPSAIQCDTIEQSDFEDHTSSDHDSDLEYPAITPSANDSPDYKFNTVSPQSLLAGESDSAADKKKVAPRSGLQFKPGPTFECTDLYKPIYLDSNDEKVFPFVSARIDRGFDFINGEWIGYKRNYFTLVAAFEFEQYEPSIFSSDKFYTLNDKNNKVDIKYFAIRLVSKCCEDDVPVSLVQHTAKRDRGPQFRPPIYPAISGTLPSHVLIKSSANIRNESKIDQFNKLFFFDGNEEEKPFCSILNTYPEGMISTVARYERIQFSTSINQRKPSMVNRHFILQVELLGYIAESEYVILAATETPPLIIRGRSPSNYQIAKMTSKLSSMKQKVDPYLSFESCKGNFEGTTKFEAKTQEKPPNRIFNKRPNQIQPIESRSNKMASLEGKDIIDEMSVTGENEPRRRTNIKNKHKKDKHNPNYNKESIENSINAYIEDNTEIENENKNIVHDEINDDSKFKSNDVPDNDENYNIEDSSQDNITPSYGEKDQTVKVANSLQLVTNYADLSNAKLTTSPYIKDSIDSRDVSSIFKYSDKIDPCISTSLDDNNQSGFILESQYHFSGFTDPAVVTKKSKKKKSHKSQSSKKRRKKENSVYYSTDIDSELFDFSHDISDPDIRYSQSSFMSEFLA